MNCSRRGDAVAAKSVAVDSIGLEHCYCLVNKIDFVATNFVGNRFVPERSGYDCCVG